MVGRAASAPADGGQASRTCRRAGRRPSLPMVSVAVADSPRRMARGASRSARMARGEGAATTSTRTARATPAVHTTADSGRGKAMTATAPSAIAHTLRSVRYTLSPRMGGRALSGAPPRSAGRP